MKSKTVGQDMYLEREVKVLKTFTKKERFIFNGQIWVLDQSISKPEANKEQESDLQKQTTLIVAKPQGSFVKFLKSQT